MKKIIAALLLVGVSQVALALPSPAEIATSVKSGRLTDAETMLQQVIKARPQSAKAYYELGQVFAMENRKPAALQALHEAERLDSSLRFANNPTHFHALINKLEGKNGTPNPASNLIAATPARSGSNFSWLYVLLGGAILVALGLALRRSTSAAGSGSLMPYAAGPVAGYGPMPPPAPYAPGAPGSGIGSAVLGGVAGMATGYGLARLMEHENGQPVQVQGVASAAADTGFVQPDDGDFDAGPGDGWDAGDSLGGADGW